MAAKRRRVQGAGLGRQPDHRGGDGEHDRGQEEHLVGGHHHRLGLGHLVELIERLGGSKAGAR